MGNELRSQHGDGDSFGEIGKIDRAKQPGVITRPAGNNINITRRLEFSNHRFDVAGIFEQVKEFTRHLRLLVNFFEHKMIVAALLDDFYAIFDEFGGALDKAAIFDIADFIAARPKGDDLAIVQADDLAGDRQNRRQV